MGELKLQDFTDYKDGDDDGQDMVDVSIREVENGYILTESYDDGEYVYVFNNSVEVINHLMDLYGVKK